MKWGSYNSSTEPSKFSSVNKGTPVVHYTTAMIDLIVVKYRVHVLNKSTNHQTSVFCVFQLLHAQRAGLEWHEELETVSVQAGLKGKKLSKVCFRKAELLP